MVISAGGATVDRIAMIAKPDPVLREQPKYG